MFGFVNAQLWLYLRVATTEFFMYLKKAAAFVLTCMLFSCDRPASTPNEAADLLTAVPKWKIEEIAVNDAVTFKDGKMTQQFGGVDFQRYMETVEIKKDGTFSGIFKGERKPFLLKWQTTDQQISIGAAEGSGQGEWTVQPQDVRKDAFTMKTRSTAYDYPRMTTIALKFKAAP